MYKRFSITSRSLRDVIAATVCVAEAMGLSHLVSLLS